MELSSNAFGLLHVKENHILPVKYELHDISLMKYELHDYPSFERIIKKSSFMLEACTNIGSFHSNQNITQMVK